MTFTSFALISIPEQLMFTLISEKLPFSSAFHHWAAWRLHCYTCFYGIWPKLCQTGPCAGKKWYKCSYKHPSWSTISLILKKRVVENFEPGLLESLAESHWCQDVVGKKKCPLCWPNWYAPGIHHGTHLLFRVSIFFSCRRCLDL